jgi:aryl-alcohol dehydrogenase-like predicted oxidoreductase
MNYVTLGKTGLKAAVVSFGGIPIQRADGANTKAVVDKLEEYGINYIDTARGYTVSEEYLGAALEGRRDKFILATKSMSRDAASMAADVETSLRNLRTGYIDLYQLHNLPEKDIEKVFGPGGAYEALTAAREAGKIGHIGVTAHSADALKILVEDYADRIETVMFPYNIVEDQGRDVLALAREKGIGIAAASPRDMDKADAADRKRQAFLRYLDDIDEAVHARRLDGGETGLIGVAEYMFTVRPDGTFTDPVLRASSGSPQLDASARRAVLAASGKVRRPAIIGTEPIPVILHVKYQYGLR